ncbi:PREDICTED: CRM-domain containing factor CFM2, chloroplastic [Nelumbo nucifera]|uniref:CRM-domain containing factor CFM2, chloroplastic n=1 Tax=Nelumbo nucifera TaxID=4432 RepID=A0A1U8A0U2_NELNU|nr:PREDICTED: CRM-domain containing factor CFM2, chloroplastic [Nelumbo nucifera]
MLLPPYHLIPSFSTKTLDSAPLFFPSPSPKILIFQNPKPPKFLLQSYAADVRTVSKTAIQRISEKLRSLGYLEDNSRESQQPETNHGSAGEIFIPFSHELPKYRVGYTIDSSWSTPENPVPHPGSGAALSRFQELKRKVEKQKRSTKKEERAPTLAELTIPEQELKRLITIGIGLKKKLKVGKAGITEGIVNGIHERWRRSELVKIRFEDLCSMNMKRTHDILERKTGGLVVWRSGSTIILYRGANYEYPYFKANKNTASDTSNTNSGGDGGSTNSLHKVDKESAQTGQSNGIACPPLVHGVGSPDKVRFQLQGEIEFAEEADCLLDGLGPRFTDWWGYDPLPVDADLLPAVVPGYRKPFRLLPYGIQPKLTNDEMTILRRLSRPLPCHFALGRNRKLQGLAVSMVKLWEKCEIAKIAVKRGVQNTNSELMAEELKRLTGGILLSRDVEFIVFYRGKDFLPPSVSTAIEERRKHGTGRSKQRVENSSLIDNMPETDIKTAGHPSANKFEGGYDQKRNLISDKTKESSKSAIYRITTKLSLALEKKTKAEKLLADLEKAVEPQKQESDREGITEEERYMLRKVGLRMKPFLLLGRRGVFDGTVENMHLHWKYRELVKVISSERSIEDVQRTARTLEAESGGILVAVERVNKGCAIIVYRGKNYQRPVDLRPRTLLNKKAAMKRSLEAQRHKSLKLHILRLTRDIDQLKLQLGNENMKTNCLQSTAQKIPDTESVTSEIYDSTDSVHDQEGVEAAERHESGSTSTCSNFCMHMSSDTAETPEQDKFVDSISRYEDETDKAELESSSEQVLEETDSNNFSDEVEERGTGVSISHSESSMWHGGTTYSVNDNGTTGLSEDETRESPVESIGGKPELSVHKDVQKGNNEVSFRASPLSNRDRLILRKQALKMKRRPVLAVGKNNIITGVAKAIQIHFQKHPLAIVNIKGRAKGTSVQEVVFMLEQATGAVLVSQEPSKVILYRGWGKDDKPSGANKDTRNSLKTWPDKGENTLGSVPPQLMAAIRLECGFQSSQEEVNL